MGSGSALTQPHRTLCPTLHEQEEATQEAGNSAGGEDAMVYPEFMEGVASVAHYKLCSPYVCMSKR